MKISPTQSDFLNWSRWVAAWFVVAEHARSLVFVDFGELHAPGILAKGFYFLTGFGHEAVMVFFVISGYLVGGKVWSLYREGRFAWRRYLADRLSRLYAVLIVALVLGAALDWTGYMFFNKYGLYNHGYAGSIAVLGTAPITRMDWQDFLANSLFLQTILGPTFGSNGPLWSLAYEWWYYILFPLVLAALWPIVNSGWRRTEEKAETLKKLKAEKVQPRIAQMGTDEEARGTEKGERGTAKSGNAQKLKHEIGKIIDSKIIGTTKDTNQHEKEEAGARLASQSGAAFSNPFTSELAWDSENTSFTRSASGPAGALRSGEMGSGGGNQLGDSVEFLDGQSQAGLQMDSQKRHSPRAATGSDTSGEISLSVPIRDIRGSKS